jgi:1-deoxy-D-xylulose-5-phosphate reductoisomerase
LKNIKPKDAIKHPVWNMGKKISVDSATMINKALEIIEASVLFGIEGKKIEVVIHPQSIVHGLVHYNDGSIIANLGYPDMITPLSVALGWPNRLDLDLKKISLIEISNLTFLKPDFDKFPGLKLGWNAIENPYCSPIVLNASNEIAVEYFLNNQIKFTDIYKVITEILNAYSPKNPTCIDDIIEIDTLTRLKTLNYIKRRL